MEKNNCVRELTLKPDMKCTYTSPGCEFWDGPILYTFVPAFKLEKMMPLIMRDPGTLMVWVSDSHNAVVASMGSKK